MLSILLGIVLGVLIYYKIFKPTHYWEDRDVPNSHSRPLIGNMGDIVLRKKHFVDVTSDIYTKFPKERYVGFMQFTTPFLLLRDLELIKQIGIKDFEFFHDHLPVNQSTDDPLLSKTLISLDGENWKQMRATLSPVFTSSKMKNMYHLMDECAENFVNHFKGKERVAVEMKDIFSRFANDVIATTAFGIQVDSLKEASNEFFTMGKSLTSLNFMKNLKIFILQLSPKLANLMKIRLLPEDASSFFSSIIKDTIKKRETQEIIRPDLIHLLIEARKGQLKPEINKNENEESFASVDESHIGKTGKQMKLTEEHIIAQALIFFFAGFDTASTALCFMAHELAVNPEVQKKLQNEIDEVNQKTQGKVPYETLLSMKYLDQVICETLRKWPPGFQTDRSCTKNYTIQPKNNNERMLVIEKGIPVMIPIMAIHRDPQYYPEPDRFDPERFNDENKAKIVSGSYLPFGIGPRNCIGSRFALLEIKILFFHLLTKFDIVPTNGTEIPLKISPKNINLAPEKGFRLGFKPRKITFY